MVDMDQVQERHTGKLEGLLFRISTIKLIDKYKLKTLQTLLVNMRSSSASDYRASNSSRLEEPTQVTGELKIQKYHL